MFWDDLSTDNEEGDCERNRREREWEMGGVGEGRWWMKVAKEKEWKVKEGQKEGKRNESKEDGDDGKEMEK